MSESDFAAVHRALSDPKRFAIFQQIAGAPFVLCGDLYAQAHLSPATISHHVRELQEAGLVETVRDGRCLQLSVRRERWRAYLKALAAL